MTIKIMNPGYRPWQSVGDDTMELGPADELPYGGGPATGGKPMPPKYNVPMKSPWNPTNNASIDQEQLNPGGGGSLPNIFGAIPGPLWLKGLIGGVAGSVIPTPAQAPGVGTNMWNMRPSGVGPTEDLSPDTNPHATGLIPANEPQPPPRPKDLGPAIKKIAKAAVKASAKVPKTAGAPNLGYYSPNTGNARGGASPTFGAATWNQYTDPNDPRIYKGPLQ